MPTNIPNAHIQAAVAATRRYSLLTAQALAGLKPQLFESSRRAKAALFAGVRHGLLEKGRLHPGRIAFFPVRNGRPDRLSEMAKIRAYAALAVCAASSGRRTRVTSDEFQKTFSDLYRPGMAMNYVLDRSEREPRLAFLRIDTGGHARWDRIVAKLLADARRHRLNPAFRRLVERRSVEIRLVTALPQKADRVCRALQSRPAQPEIPIHISVVPELINLIAPLPLD